MERYVASRSDIEKMIVGGNSPFRSVNPEKLQYSWIPPAGRNSLYGVPSDTIPILLDLVSEAWDDFGGAWVNQNHTSHLYDSEGRVLQTDQQMWFMNTWQNNSQVNYQYDGIGTLRKVLIRKWNGGAWVDNIEDTITYNAFGKVTEESLRMFNGSSWVNFQKYSSLYDSTGRMEEARTESWSGSEWQNQEVYIFLYAGGGQIKELINRVWNGGEWVNSLRDSNSFDGSGNQTGKLNQYWSADSWNDDTRTLASYDDNNLLIETVEQSWSSSAWINESRRSFNNDLDGYATEILIDYWDGVDWSNEGILYHTYDGPNVVEDYFVEWDGFSWVGKHKVSYSWETIVTPNQTTQQYPVRGKWNLVSVPLSVPDYGKTTLFPNASSSAFYFDAGYTAATMLENGRGYWIKFDADQSVTMVGTKRATDTVAVVAGWNLIGSLSASIPASAAGSIPGGLVVSSFFGFNAGYQASDVIEPGKAYWVKVAEAGQLILSSTGAMPASARVKMELTDETPPAPPADGVVESGSVPRSNALGQNYPNPFNPVTTIAFTLLEAGHVRLSVYNVIGHEVAVLVDGIREVGAQSVTFDAGEFPSGVYFYKISAPDFSGMKRMVLLK